MVFNRLLPAILRNRQVNSVPASATSLRLVANGNAGLVAKSNLVLGGTSVSYANSRLIVSASLAQIGTTELGMVAAVVANSFKVNAFDAEFSFRLQGGLVASPITTTTSKAIFGLSAGVQANTLVTKITSLPFFLKAIDPVSLNEGLPLWVWGTANSGQFNTLPFFLQVEAATGTPSNNIPFFTLALSDTKEKSLPLYIKGSYLGAAGSLPFYLANSGLTSNIPFFIEGQRLTVGFDPRYNSDGFYPAFASIPFYLERIIVVAGSLPMFLMNQISESGLPFFTKGAYLAESGLMMFTQGISNSNNGINAYIRGF